MCGQYDPLWRWNRWNIVKHQTSSHPCLASKYSLNAVRKSSLAALLFWKHVNVSFRFKEPTSPISDDYCSPRLPTSSCFVNAVVISDLRLCFLICGCVFTSGPPYILHINVERILQFNKKYKCHAELLYWYTRYSIIVFQYKLLLFG